MPNDLLVLAIDLGTSSCKGALYDRNGRRVAIARYEYPLSRPTPHFVEQDPADYLRAARRVSAELGAAAESEGGRIVAVGLSTQTPTLLFLDSTGEPLIPAILWQDTRASAEAAWWNDSVPESTRSEWFGMDLPIGAASLPAKVLWVARNQPAIWKRTRWVVQPKDSLAFRLTGQMTTDHWCAKGLAHLGTGAVHPDLMRQLGKSESPSGEVRRATAVNGTVTERAAAEFQLPRGIPVGVGWSDALAGILAVGALHSEGRGFVLTGTSGIVGVSRLGGERSPGLFVVPGSVIELHGLELHYGPIHAGGVTLEWAARLFGKTTDEVLGLLDAEPGPASERILFRPHLEGERAPFWDHTLSAGFEGLRIEHRMADMVKAVLRGVALQERLVLELADRESRCHELALGGGASRDRRWNRIRADILQRDVLVSSDVEASLRGAALLAWGMLDPELLRHPGEGWFPTERIRRDEAARGEAEKQFAVYQRRTREGG